MNKVVYNSTYGGYCLSKTAVEWLAENARDEVKAIAAECIQKKAFALYPIKENKEGTALYEVERHDPDLVRCVETLGKAANGGFAKLAIRELKGNRYRIDDYDGWEEVYEPEDEKYITIE